MSSAIAGCSVDNQKNSKEVNIKPLESSVLIDTIIRDCSTKTSEICNEINEAGKIAKREYLDKISEEGKILDYNSQEKNMKISEYN